MFKTPFKPTGHYVFNYKPRYYDERKERLLALEDRYKRERNEDEENEFTVTLSKNNLKHEWNRSRSSSNADRKTTYRLAIIIAILSITAIYILR
ncbi:MAG: hypothetical protein ACN4EF_03435 [Wenyingzhuangia sp.]|jgi:hypothetical protein|uniref:hypothetical protein n=1 Tax=Wenyingzhuangia sp. TaxID=1964193 RepID=UPI00321B956E